MLQDEFDLLIFIESLIKKSFFFEMYFKNIKDLVLFEIIEEGIENDYWLLEILKVFEMQVICICIWFGVD